MEWEKHNPKYYQTCHIPSTEPTSLATPQPQFVSPKTHRDWEEPFSNSSSMKSSKNNTKSLHKLLLLWIISDRKSSPPENRQDSCCWNLSMDWVHRVSRKETAAAHNKDLTGMELPLKEWLSQNQLLHSWSLQLDLQWKHKNRSKIHIVGEEKITDDIGFMAYESSTPFLSQLIKQVHLHPSRGSALFCLHSPPESLLFQGTNFYCS